MTNDNKETLMVTVVIGIFFALGVWLGYNFGKYNTQISAVRAGVGEHVIVDKEIGSTQFQFKTNTANLK